MNAAVDIELSAVIVAVTDELPRLVTVRSTAEGLPALPSGRFEPELDRTLDTALRRWVRESAGLELGYVEQLYTFGDRYRDPREQAGGPRVVSVAYLALARQTGLSMPQAAWRDWYEFFPWEDWRRGRPSELDEGLARLEAWCYAAPDGSAAEARRERLDIAFGLRAGTWDEERVLDRYELLYEAGLVAEASRPAGAGLALGAEMLHDHRRILAAALGRLRAKLKYRPVVFELLPPRFTLLQLQRLVEALAGVRVHKQNFRRVVSLGGLVEGTGQQETRTGGRPAELFAFRREVLRERPAPGLGLPRGV